MLSGHCGGFLALLGGDVATRWACLLTCRSCFDVVGRGEGWWRVSGGGSGRGCGDLMDIRQLSMGNLIWSERAYVLLIFLTYINQLVLLSKSLENKSHKAVSSNLVLCKIFQHMTKMPRPSELSAWVRSRPCRMRTAKFLVVRVKL